MTKEQEMRIEELRRRWSKASEKMQRRAWKEKDPAERLELEHAAWTYGGNAWAAEYILEILRGERE